MKDFTKTFLIGEGIQQDKVLKNIDKVNEKAFKEIEKGNNNATFLIAGMLFSIINSDELPDIETDDKYVIIVSEK